MSSDKIKESVVFVFFQAPWECLDSVGVVGVFDEVVLGTKVLPLSW